MKKLFVAVLLLVMSVCAVAQTPANKAEKHSTKSATVTAALLQQVWDAWCTLNPANAAKYYDKTPGNIYFDITPLEYRSWAEYESGAKNVLAGFKSGSAKVDEVHIHPAGSATWATAIVHLDMEMKDGTKSKADWRWTSVWEKRDGTWKNVHEHVSEPAK